MKVGLFSDRDFNRKLIRYALPFGFQSLMLAMVAAADALMLGNIAQDAMSAVSLATQYQFIQNMMISAVVGAVCILGAQYWGKGDKESVRETFNIGLRWGLAFSVVSCLASVLVPEFLMSLFTNSEDLQLLGAKYLKIAGWSYLLTGISQSYIGMLKVSERPRYAAVISSSTVVINIILNAVFIYGLFGLPKMEVEGAAVATLLSRVIELIWSVSVSFGKGYLRPLYSKIFRINRMLSLDYFKMVMPHIGASLLWSVGFTMYTAFIGHLGKDATAANSVTSVVRDLMCCVTDGVSAGGGILVGNALGAGDLEKGKTYGIRLMKMSYLIGILGTVSMLALIPALTGAVKLSDDAKRYFIFFMIIMAVYMIGRAVNTVVINGIFGAGGDTVFDMYSLVAMMWCLAIPLAAFGTFVFHWSPIVVYAMTCLDEVGKLPWVMAHFFRFKWVKNLTREF